MIAAGALALAVATAAVWWGDRFWPMSALSLAPLALAWAALAALGLARCLPLAGPLRADPVQGLARAAMLPMLAGLPTMLALCSPQGWPPAALLALHSLVMLAPMAWPRRVAGGAIAVAMAASALPLLAWPGVAGWMVASALQALACGLAMRQPPAHLAAGRAAAASVAATAALALGLAQGGLPLLQQLQLALALAAPLAWAGFGARRAGSAQVHPVRQLVRVAATVGERKVP